MNKNNQLNEKAQYAAPSCKSVVLEASASFMNPASPNYNSRWNTEVIGTDETEIDL